MLHMWYYVRISKSTWQLKLTDSDDEAYDSDDSQTFVTVFYHILFWSNYHKWLLLTRENQIFSHR